jgi:hypothetical protein
MNPFAKPKPTDSEVRVAVRDAIAENAVADSIVEDMQIPPEVMEAAQAEEHFNESVKLSKLIDDDFPFDESQIGAIEGMVGEQYACLTGAAGTGKTTTTKKLVDRLLESVSFTAVNMTTYWKVDSSADADDEYDSEKEWVPSVVMGAFTGRATQMIKKNFPRDWHGNIMTIHRMLGFYPEMYDDWDDETQDYRKKMRFVPTYNADFLMPWDVYILDEAGMLGVDLWHQFLAAVKPGARIYMVGDINQLPPVHGKSVFGFAMSKWPAWELTHVHRQQGKDNPIVDNAWRILHGRMPVSGGRFQMIELKGDAQVCSRRLRAMLPALQDKGIYDPIRDTVITPINGEEGSRGFALGQLPLNRELALIFNPASEHPRYIIDGGRERKQFAVNDKVMATKNDWEAGITNGMTGIITSIAQHEGYAGVRQLFGTVEAVNAYLAESGEHEGDDFSLEDLNDSFEAIDKGMKDKKEKRERGPSSHIVTVRFGEGDHAFEIPFQTLSEVGSLMTAYVVTCHKMQGGESPTVIIIAHDAHKSMLYREWLYTAVTRASEKCILLYTTTALRTALNKQSIKGSTLQEKVKAFNAAMDPKGLLGAAIKVRIPESTSTAKRIMEQKALVPAAARHMTTEKEKAGGFAQLLREQKERMQGETIPPKPEPIRPIHVHIHVTGRMTGHKASPAVMDDPEPKAVDGGELKAQHREQRQKELDAALNHLNRLAPVRTFNQALALPASPKPTHTSEQLFDIHRWCADAFFSTPLMLTHQPAPEPVKPVNPMQAFLMKGK